MQSHYDLLEISKDANKDEITFAYRAQAFLYHPDRNHSEGATERFQAVSASFKILSDENQRRLYDLDIAEKTRGMSFSILSDGDSQASSTALAIQKNYNFSQIITSANLPAPARLKIAQESEEVALIFIANNNFQSGWSWQDKIALAQNYEKVALYLVDNINYIYTHLLQESFSILEKYKLVTKAFLEKSQLANKLNGNQLAALVKKHGNFFALNWQIEHLEVLRLRLATFRNQQVSPPLAAEFEAEVASGSSVSSASSVPANQGYTLNFKERAKLVFEFSMLKTSEISEEKNLTKLRAFFANDTEALMWWAEGFAKFAEVVLADEPLRKNLNGFHIYELIQNHGEVLKAVCQRHESPYQKYSAFNKLINYKELDCQEHPATLFAQTKIAIKDLHLIVKKYKPFAEVYIEKYTQYPALLDRDAVVFAAFYHDQLALKIYATPLLIPIFNNRVMNKKDMNINSSNKCKLVLNNSELNNNLSGEDLHEFIVQFGDEMSEIIFADPILSERILAYQVLVKAQKQGKLHLEERTTLALGVEDKADLLYQRGLDYLKIPQTLKTAAECFRKAAALGHESAFRQLLQLIDKIDKKYYYIIGELYFNSTNIFSDRAKAEFCFFKAVEYGEIKAISKLLEILDSDVFFKELKGSIAENPIFNFCSQKIAECSSQLALHESNKLWHKLFKICCVADAKKEAIYISQFISNKNAEDFFTLGHLQLDYHSQQSELLIQKEHPNWSDEQIRFEMLEPELTAMRLNAAIPYFIHSVNMYADFSLETLVRFLRILACTQLANAEVCSLVLKNKELAGHKDFPPEELFLICRANPMIICHNDAALSVVQYIKSPEQLYELGWKCLLHLNKVCASTYLFWFKASQCGHAKAAMLVNYLSSPHNFDEQSRLLKTLGIHLDLENDDGLENDNVMPHSSDKFKDIVGTLIFCFNQPETFSLSNSLVHLCAKLDDVNLLPKSEWKTIDTLDRNQQSPLEVLFNTWGSSAVQRWHAVFQEDKASVDTFYLALMNTRGDVSVEYRELQQQFISTYLDSFRNLKQVQKSVLLRSLWYLAKANDVEGVNFVIRSVDPAIAIGVINGLLKNLFTSSTSNSLFIPAASGEIKTSLHAYRDEIMKHWGDLIQDLLVHLRTYPMEQIFFDYGYQAKLCFATSLKAIKLTSHQDESNGLIDLQVAIHLTTFMNTLLEQNHQTCLAKICRFMKINKIHESVLVEDVKQVVAASFRRSMRVNRFEARLLNNIRGINKT